MTAPAIGIDLGTTYSCVGVFQNGRVELIANDLGNRTTPSYVAFTETERLVGEAAKNQAAINPNNTVFDAKRLIGRRFADPTVKEDMKHWPFRVVEDDGSPKIKVTSRKEVKLLTPEEISSMVLIKMKETAENYIGMTVSSAVITVPANFNDSQRQATRDAGTIAGLTDIRVINEPTAAALAYGLDKKMSRDKNILVFDLGGGTLDVSILQVGKSSQFTVKATAGDPHLGGEDFDNRIVDHFVQEFKKTEKKDLKLKKNVKSLLKLRVACEQAKRVLSSRNSAKIAVDALIDGEDYQNTIDRSRFEILCSDLFDRVLLPVEDVLQEATLPKSKINEIVLVGGSTRIPKIQELLQQYMGKKALSKSINPDEAVAQGAAIFAAVLYNEDMDETIPDMELIDVAPLSLGIHLQDGTMSKIIARNSRIPTEGTANYHTTYGYGCSIKIYEGERTMARDNHFLGEFTMSGYYGEPRSVPLQITMSIDEDGILEVFATDTFTGKHASQIEIVNEKGRLSKAEIERMMEEAKKYRAFDIFETERNNARNNLEGTVVKIKQAVESAGASLSPADKKLVIAQCTKIRQWLHRNKQAAVCEYEEKEDDLKDLFEARITYKVVRGGRGKGRGRGGRFEHKRTGYAQSSSEEDWSSAFNHEMWFN